jgi:hypothetical protein
MVQGEELGTLFFQSPNTGWPLPGETDSIMNFSPNQTILKWWKGYETIFWLNHLNGTMDLE